jgi:hypothetical protein
MSIEGATSQVHVEIDPTEACWYVVEPHVHGSGSRFHVVIETRGTALVLCLPEDDVTGVERLLSELLLDLGASLARR